MNQANSGWEGEREKQRKGHEIEVCTPPPRTEAGAKLGWRFCSIMILNNVLDKSKHFYFQIVLNSISLILSVIEIIKKNRQ